MIQRSGHLEYHLPVRYDASRPAFRFTTAEHRMSIASHILGSRLPRPGDGSTHFYPSPAEFAPLLRHPQSPLWISDWIYSDIPQLHIHVVVFQDATLITITHLHTSFDAMTRAAFIKAWAASVSGRDQDIPRCIPIDHDPFAGVGKEKASARNYVYYEHLFSWPAVITFLLRLLFDILWHWKEEEHTFRLPGRCVDRMREATLCSLAPVADKSTPGQAPFVSESDIILSWWTRTIVKTLNVAPYRPIMIMNIVNISALFADQIPSGAVCVGNTASMANTMLSAHEAVGDEGLAHVSSKLRQDIVTHRTREQVDALVSIQTHSLTTIMSSLIGGGNILFLPCSNHHKGRYFEADFSAALVRTLVQDESSHHIRGRPSFVNDGYHCERIPSRNFLRVLGKDANGDWWLASRTRAGAWTVIQKELLALVEYREEC